MEENNSTGKDHKKPHRKIRKLRVTTLVLAVLAIAVISSYYFFEDNGLKEAGTNHSGEPSQEKQKVHRGYVFEKEGPLWKTKWLKGNQIYNLDFRSHPEEVAHIPIEGTLDERINNKTVFLTIDGNNDTSKTEEYAQLSLAVYGLSTKLATVLNKDVTAACTSNSSEVCKTRPVATCETEEAAVIYFKDAPEPRILLDGNCITIEGRGEDTVKAVDKLLYKLLSIVE